MNPDDPNDKDPENQNEGEGSRTAARRYNEGARAFLKRLYHRVRNMIPRRKSAARPM